MKTEIWMLFFPVYSRTTDDFACVSATELERLNQQQQAWHDEDTNGKPFATVFFFVIALLFVLIN